MQNNDRLFIDKFDNFILTVRNIIYYGDTKKCIMPIDPKHDRQRFIRYFNDNTIYYDTLNDSFRFQNDYTLKYEFALLYTYKSIGIIEMGDLLQIFSHLSCRNGKTATYISAASRSEKNVNRRLENKGELVQSGSIIPCGKNPREYVCNIDILENFSRPSKERFIKALDFAIKKTNFVTFGVTYRQLVECRDILKGSHNQDIQIDHQLFHPILDELHIWVAISAIDEKKYVSIDYFKYEHNNKFIKTFQNLIPLLIVYDNLHGRSYLCLYDERIKNLFSLRFDRIYKIKMNSDAFCESVYRIQLANLKERLRTAWLIDLQNEPQQVVIRFNKEPGIKARIENEKRDGIITEREDCYLFEISVNNPHEMKGWIMSFGAKCVVQRPQALVDDIIKTLEEITK